MTCLRCGAALEPCFSDVHYCLACIPDVLPPAPFATRMREGSMKRAGRWALFPHEWFYTHDPRYNPSLRTLWRNFPVVADRPSPYPAWW